MTHREHYRQEDLVPTASFLEELNDIAEINPAGADFRLLGELHDQLKHGTHIEKADAEIVSMLIRKALGKIDVIDIQDTHPQLRIYRDKSA